MSSIWNKKISIAVFGEVDSPAVGVTIDNLPAGEYINADELVKFMSRLAPKTAGTAHESKVSMPRIMSGICNDRTTGAPVCAFIQNGIKKPAPEPPRDVLTRAGNADYTGAVRYRGYSDVAAKSHYAESIAAPFCFAGAVCGQILERRGIYTGAHIAKIHNIKDNPFDHVRLTRDHVLSVRMKNFPVINDRKGWLMEEDIIKAQEAGESLGGVIECGAVNIPAGVGSPVFDGLESSIAQLTFGISGVKGLEFGAGFKAAKMIGSQNRDDFYVDGHGYILTKTNNHGGVIQGISSGMPITIKAAFNPTGTYADNPDGYEACSVPKAVPCVESAVNIALLSHMLDYPNFC